MKRYIGLIGYPLKHSISPVFQQAALDFYGLDIRYLLWETAAPEFASSIERIKLPQNLGANVTVPYKEKVLPLLDEIDELALTIGAVNTIVKKGKRLKGFNTDACGFLNSLKEQAGFIITGKSAMVLGAGGAAKAVCFSLINEGLEKLTIVNRNAERLRLLKEHLNRYSIARKFDTEITILPFDEKGIGTHIGDCQLVINCTTYGMKYGDMENFSPLSKELIPASALIYDLVYNPAETPLLRIARQAGAQVLGGLFMLIYQGATAFELWTGQNAPVDEMLKAGKKALE